jgi:tyrosyl-tRNA synthetase
MVPGDSKAQIKALIKNGGVYVNGLKISSDAETLGSLKAIKQRYYVFRLAKKNFFTLDFGSPLNKF